MWLIIKKSFSVALSIVNVMLAIMILITGISDYTMWKEIEDKNDSINYISHCIKDDYQVSVNNEIVSGKIDTTELYNKHDVFVDKNNKIIYFLDIKTYNNREKFLMLTPFYDLMQPREYSNM